MLLFALFYSHKFTAKTNTKRFYRPRLVCSRHHQSDASQKQLAGGIYYKVPPDSWEKKKGIFPGMAHSAFQTTCLILAIVRNPALCGGSAGYSLFLGSPVGLNPAKPRCQRRDKNTPDLFRTIEISRCVGHCTIRCLDFDHLPSVERFRSDRECHSPSADSFNGRS